MAGVSSILSTWEPRQIGQTSWQVVHVLHLCRKNLWRQRIAQLHLPLVEVIGSLWHFFQYYKRKEADFYQAAYLQRGAVEGRRGSPTSVRVSLRDGAL